MAESSSQADTGNPPSSQKAAQAASNSTPLPKCFCNWKNCRTYQKAFREYKHPHFNGVIKLKFIKSDPRSMALKAAVDRTLHVDPQRRNDWKQVGNGEPFCRYYVARHHFTESLIDEYFQDRRGWDWNRPLDMKEAKKFLWSLDRDDVYHSEGEDSDEEDDRYVQAPNVPKDKVREMLKEFKDQHKREMDQHKREIESAAEAAKEEQTTVSTARSTHGDSVADSLKVVESSEVQQTRGVPSPKSDLLAQKEDENRKLREEISDCQMQLNNLRDMVKKLVDMDRSRSKEVPKKKKSSCKKKSKSRRRTDSSSDEDSDDDDSSSEEEWSQERGRNQPSDDDDETISTLHINSEVGHQQPKNSAPLPKPRPARQPVRKTSIHSRRSMRRSSMHSRRESVRSRHSTRRDSIHSRRSIRGGVDDNASVASRQSLASVSPSIKSLPREIELNDEEEEDSFFDDSYRKPDDDARSLGSRSTASKASRRSFVSGQRSRGRNSRRPGQASTSSHRRRQGANVSASDSRSNVSDGGSGNGRNVPREIDLSGDELEDVTYSNVSNDTSYVKDKQIVDPYGEKGVYTGELSKSTCMPNGRGKLEYEKEGRWYDGDWIHGRWTGTGCLSNGDGDYYQGGLKNDHKHGEGVMKFADGRIFEGEYIRGQMIEGKMTYQDGSVYGGSWVDGMRHGQGKCVFVDGSEYDGEFQEGNFHGHGKMTWNDGGWYVGEWCDGEMHGRGSEIRPDGSLRHDGEWARGQPIRSAADSRRRRQQMSDS